MSLWFDRHGPLTYKSACHACCMLKREMKAKSPFSLGVGLRASAWRRVAPALFALGGVFAVIVNRVNRVNRATRLDRRADKIAHWAQRTHTREVCVVCTKQGVQLLYVWPCAYKYETRSGPVLSTHRSTGSGTSTTRHRTATFLLCQL